MTTYSTESEAEGYAATELARIALQAAIDAVDAYQARHGIVDAPFRVTLHCDGGDEADRESSEPNDALRRAAEAHDRYTGRDGWIRDDDDKCPVHPMDVVQLKQGTDYVLENKHGVPANHFSWGPVSHYRPLRDDEGVPYCSAEGLEYWAEYVATDDESGSVWQYSYPPVQHDHHWDEGDTNDRRGIENPAPKRFSNTRDHWTQTLRRVWRKEDA